MSNVQVRVETAADVHGIHAVNAAAFDRVLEASLVDIVRQTACPIVSLVADNAGEIVGHILFSPVTLSGQPEARIMGLAPMAVLPSQQRRGVGSALVRDGLNRAETSDTAPSWWLATETTTRDSDSSQGRRSI